VKQLHLIGRGVYEKGELLWKDGEVPVQ